MRLLRNLETLRFRNVPRDLLEDLGDGDAGLRFLNLRDMIVDTTPGSFGGSLAATETAGLLNCALRLERLSVTADAVFDMHDDEPQTRQTPLEEVNLDIRGDVRAVTDFMDTILPCANRATLISLIVNNDPFSASFFSTIGSFRDLRQLLLVWPTDDAFACCAPHLLLAMRDLRRLQSVALIYPDCPQYASPASRFSEMVLAEPWPPPAPPA